MSQTYTVTFSENVENHAGMEVLSMADVKKGLTLADMRIIRNNYSYELYNLNTCADEDEAWILIMRNGVAQLGIDPNALLAEMESIHFDTLALMRGRVVNKRARYNVCFADRTQVADCENGKGTILAFDDLPTLKALRGALDEVSPVKQLFAEGNHYYDINSCGIGYHGDSERRIVIGVRLGATMPLHYQWYRNSIPYGENMWFALDNGDVYFMSDKATGHDWKKKKVPTLRHAAGCSKYTTPH